LTILGIDERERAALARDLESKTEMTVQESPLDEGMLRKVLPNTQVLIHCTPMGMSPKVHETSVPAALLHAGLTVMDIVYNPRDTRLLKEAKGIGCRTIPGIEMFLHQAAAQFELWTNQAAPTDVMRAVLESRFS
jgi:shikimate dehydrogenase